METDVAKSVRSIDREPRLLRADADLRGEEKEAVDGVGCAR